MYLAVSPAVRSLMSANAARQEPCAVLPHFQSTLHTWSPGDPRSSRRVREPAVPQSCNYSYKRSGSLLCIRLACPAWPSSPGATTNFGAGLIPATNHQSASHPPLFSRNPFPLGILWSRRNAVPSPSSFARPGQVWANLSPSLVFSDPTRAEPPVLPPWSIPAMAGQPALGSVLTSTSTSRTDALSRPVPT
jgi:hypothetical protein